MKKEEIIELYKDQVADLSKDIRQKAIAQFEQSGFPDKKHEEWKYTDLSALLKIKFQKAKDTGALIKKDLEKRFPCTPENYVLVFENGVFLPAMSSVKHLPDGVMVRSISEMIKEKNQNLGNAISLETEDAFTLMNSASFQEGAYISIPEKFVLDKPICIFHLHSGSEKNTIVQPRNIIHACGSSQVSVIEMYASVSGETGFTNSVTEVQVDDRASVTLYKVEQANTTSFQIDHTYVKQASNSKFSAFTITCGGELVRNKLQITVEGEHCETHMNGLYIGKGKSHIDNHTIVDHAMPNCYSNELYKGVMSGKSSAVFSGKIVVRKDAQKTNAFQSNKNILLSGESAVNSKPQLEIFADDVKCSHGASTGRIDPEALFYLHARGIGKEKAQELLTYAFANEILERIQIPELKMYLEKEILSGLTNS